MAKGSIYFPVSKLILDGNISFIRDHFLANIKGRPDRGEFRFIVHPLPLTYFPHGPHNISMIYDALIQRPENITLL